MKRVEATVLVFDTHVPPRLAPSNENRLLRDWFKKLSLAIYPAEHLVIADEERVGKRYEKGEQGHQLRSGRIAMLTPLHVAVIISNDPRPTHALSSQFDELKLFIVDKLKEQYIALPDVQMSNGEDESR